jgi:hypothetical protein
MSYLACLYFLEDGKATFLAKNTPSGGILE